MDKFTGFYHETISFLKELRENNNKMWFENNRSNYENYLLEPFKLLVCGLNETMIKIDPEFEVKPQVDKTLSRIYRDTRFSRDKSPYRPNMWLTYKRKIKEWKSSPFFFFELFIDGYRYGMGYYLASRETMDKFRNSLNINKREFLSVISPLQKENLFSLEGEAYKRKIENDLPDELHAWYQKKSFYLTCNRKINENIFSLEIINELKYGFKLLEPFYKYLMKF